MRSKLAILFLILIGVQFAVVYVKTFVPLIGRSKINCREAFP